MARILLTKDGRRFLIKDTSKDYHTEFGFIAKDDLQKKKTGSLVKTNKGTALTLIDASFIDLFQKIKRDAQIIPLKDVGLIIAETGIGKTSKIVDAGCGSGALACFLAHIVKEVISYEIRDDFIKIAEHNKEFLGLKNLKIKKGSIYENVKEKNADLFTLDVPEPWKALETASKILKPGAFFVSYSPSIPQVIDFVDVLKKNESFAYLKTCEISEREWDVEGRKVRPKSQSIGHSGFMTFARKL